ncbi:hypothetical protein GTW51_09790 [Aurantimonas aggregata]|uniref:DUF2232 domain-containing protein n=1 Tax=Aurantimonas aggregata TaxID=2047720 RepID=A0A6L9MGQ3_9HYPH|nr:hypothetical protein [Aurantimonas aggregata]NDV86995.1 hypothetical protein [Aurantimonas aggregata]
MKPTTIVIAVASGLASALLFAGIVLQSASAVSLALAAPIPIAIASLGWGSVAGFIAAAIAGATIFAVTLSVPSALTLLISMAIPTAVAGHLAGLARPAEAPMRAANGNVPATPPLDWYPLERVLMAITAMATAACLFLGWMLGYDAQLFVPAVAQALGEGGVAGPDAPDQEQLRELASLVVSLVPFVQPAMLTIILVIGLYLGATVTRISNRLPRPRDDIPSIAGLPRTTLLVFAAGLGAVLAGGTLGLIGAVIVGAFGAAYTLIGLAALHRRSRGRPGRGLVLFTSYAAILLLSFPLLVFLGLGLFQTWRHGDGTTSPASQ